MVRRDFDNFKDEDLHQLKGHQVGHHSILQHHVIPSGTRLVSQGFVLMQDKNPKHTIRLRQRYIKSKEEQNILQLMSWPAQSADLNPTEMNLTDKSELNNLQVLLTSGNSCRKAGQNYFLSTSSLGKNAEISVNQ